MDPRRTSLGPFSPRSTCPPSSPASSRWSSTQRSNRSLKRFVRIFWMVSRYKKIKKLLLGNWQRSYKTNKKPYLNCERSLLVLPNACEEWSCDRIPAGKLEKNRFFGNNILFSICDFTCNLLLTSSLYTELDTNKITRKYPLNLFNIRMFTQGRRVNFIFHQVIN
jgi:hypothetical protein